MYGAETSDAPATEFIQTHTLEDIKRIFGDGTDNELGFDYKGKNMDIRKMWSLAIRDFYGPWIMKIAAEINSRKQKDDFLLLPFGGHHKVLPELVGLEMAVESGIGYSQTIAKYRVFESNAIMNFAQGNEMRGQIHRPTPWDRVIPNYFDPDDVLFSDQKQEYFLFIGRVIYAKGITIAVKTAEALGIKLIVAGPGASWDPEKHRLWGKEFDITSPVIEYIGHVDIERRKPLMAHAKAVIVASLYNGPFEGTNVEAQLSGTPVLTTPFGVFPETVKHGETGFICHSNEEFVENAREVGALDPYKIREHAERYLMDNVKYEYQAYFDLLYQAHFGK